MSPPRDTGVHHRRPVRGRRVRSASDPGLGVGPGWPVAYGRQDVNVCVRAPAAIPHRPIFGRDSMWALSQRAPAADSPPTRTSRADFDNSMQTFTTALLILFTIILWSHFDLHLFEAPRNWGYGKIEGVVKMYGTIQPQPQNMLLGS